MQKQGCGLSFENKWSALGGSAEPPMQTKDRFIVGVDG